MSSFAKTMRHLFSNITVPRKIHELKKRNRRHSKALVSFFRRARGSRICVDEESGRVVLFDALGHEMVVTDFALIRLPACQDPVE